MDFYEYLLSKKGIRISQALSILIPRIMETKKWQNFDTYESVYQDIRSMLIDTIKRAVEDKGVPGSIKYIDSEVFRDDNGDPLQVVDVENSYIRTSNVLNWAKTNGYLTAKREDEMVVPNGSSPPKDGEPQVEPHDYPCIKGVRLEDLSNEDFTDIKKHYGMLKSAESKWKRAIPIAAKIGLLFYERNLEKPTNRPAFLEAYKQEFDDWLKNDTVAKMIYENLPEEYTGGSRKRANNLAPVIKAAVFAGSMAHDRNSMTITAFSKSLRLEDYQVPSDDVLQVIIDAVMKLELEDDE